MSYDHTLTAHIPFIQPVTEDTLLYILDPLVKELGWKKEKILANDLPPGSEINTLTNAEDEITFLFLRSEGTVTETFESTVHKVVQRLGSMVKPGFMELENLDSNHRDTKTEIWYGDIEQVKEAKIQRAWDLSKNLLLSAGVSYRVVTQMAKTGGIK